jgi:hypothetical protein
MTTTAHNARRVWGGASLAANVSPGYEPRVSMYQLLHPEMYPKQKQCQPTPLLEERHGMILTYLFVNGPATAPAMEAAFDLRRDAIGGLLRRGVAGIVVIRQEKSPHTHRMCTVWGLQDIHTAGKTE